jgi:nucleotide-binding universal stress UspA family protein
LKSDAATNQGPFRLLVGVTFSEEGRHALEAAARISRRIPECMLHVLHVVPAPGVATAPREPMTVLRDYVGETFAALGGVGGVTVAIELRRGDPVDELATLAREIAADLVVLGSDRGHRASWDKAPTAERLGDAMSCPLVVTAR